MFIIFVKIFINNTLKQYIMKILIATDSNNLESKIAKRFGEAAYYLIYNSDDEKIESRVNKGHDDNHQSLIDLVDEGVKYFLIGNTGPNAFNVLKEQGAKIFLVRNLIAKDALHKFLNNEIEELTKATLKRPIRKK